MLRVSSESQPKKAFAPMLPSVLSFERTVALLISEFAKAFSPIVPRFSGVTTDFIFESAAALPLTIITSSGTMYSDSLAKG